MHPLAQKIVAEVAKENGFTFEEMVDEGRRKRIISYARFEAMARIRMLTLPDGRTARFSLPLIGRWFNTDHTTVFHAAQRYEQAVAALVAYRKSNPVGEIPSGVLRRSGVEHGLATYVKALAVREVNRQDHEDAPTADDKHVEAILKAQPDGFVAHREVLWKMTRHGARYITLPRFYHPLAHMDDQAWAQALARAA